MEADILTEASIMKGKGCKVTIIPENGIVSLNIWRGAKRTYYMASPLSGYEVKLFTEWIEDGRNEEEVIRLLAYAREITEGGL